MKGRFQPGPDPRRHTFTEDEARRGGRASFENIMLNRPALLLWLKKKIKKSKAGAA